MKKPTIKSRLKIEKDIPIPDRFCRGEIVETLKQMKVGDSFYYEANRIDTKPAAQKLGILMTVRIDGKGYRYWRIG